MSVNIRNICLLGHGGDGKTSLAESMLFLTKGNDRLGKVADGNTICDFDPEEIRRKITVSSSLAPIEYNGFKINVLDTPGYFDFVGEVLQSLRVVDTGVICLNGKSGVGVGTEKAWKLLSAQKKSKIFYVSKLDEENSDFGRTLTQLRDTFGVSVCPFVIPCVEDGKLVGIVEIPSKKAYKMQNGARVEMPVPSGSTALVDEYYDMLAESVAETSEELMDKFFSGEAFTQEELITGIRSGIKSGSLTPVFSGSAYIGLGTLALLSGIANYAPSPEDSNEETGLDSAQKAVSVKYNPSAPTIAFVFKTTSDQYGKFSFFKVLQGKLTSDMSLINPRTGNLEKIGHLYSVKGKKNTEVKEVACGDIGAVSKLADVKTGDTLCDAHNSVALNPIVFPKPCYSLAVYPKVKGGEEKISSGLNRMAEEDFTFGFVQNVETHQMVLSGQGDIHIDVLCSRLKNKFGVEVETETPKVPYREKIRKKIKVEGKHKKQSGGHGQFGHVWIEFEPGDTEDLIFEEKIFGGSVPKNFHPAVEKGLRDRMSRGVLAGYPMVYLKATLVDGSYHDVDSSEMAFKLAAGLAYKNGLPKANPVLLEPIGNLKVFIPDSYMGDVIGDLNKRRGQVLGMNPGEDGEQVVEASVPMTEMHSYAIDLRSMTQGRGRFEFEFERYEETPPNIQQKVIAEADAIKDDLE